MDGSLLQYGALGAFTAVVLLFLRSMGAERRDRRKEREVFMELITNHVAHDREAKMELGMAIGKLCECLKTRPCLALGAKSRTMNNEQRTMDNEQRTATTNSNNKRRRTGVEG